MNVVEAEPAALSPPMITETPNQTLLQLPGRRSLYGTRGDGHCVCSSRTTSSERGHTHKARRSPPRLELGGADGYAASPIPQRGNTVRRFPLMLSASQRKERGNG